MSLRLCYRAVIAGLALVSCGRDATTPSDPPTISLSVVSGDGQTGVVGTQVPNPLVVRVTNLPNGQDITVDFQVTSGGGTLYAPAVSTLSGIAKNLWTLGTSSAQA